jgi:transposase
MLSKTIPDSLLALVVAHVPPTPKSSCRGGRPRISSECVIRAIWFVLISGCRWRDVPKEFGCSGETARRRLLAWEKLGVWKKVHMTLLDALAKSGKLNQEDVIIDSTQVRSFGGSSISGPSPVDRRKPGIKHTLLVDPSGIPIQVRSAGSNQSDHTQIIPLVVEYPIIRGRRGRPRKFPKRLYADAGYDSQAARKLLGWLGIDSYIRRRNLPHGSHLGKVRWVVERTISWFKGCRRLRINYDYSKTAISAWTRLAAITICYRIAEPNLNIIN